MSMDIVVPDRISDWAETYGNGAGAVWQKYVDAGIIFSEQVGFTIVVRWGKPAVGDANKEIIEGLIASGQLTADLCPVTKDGAILQWFSEDGNG